MKVNRERSPQNSVPLCDVWPGYCCVGADGDFYEDMTILATHNHGGVDLSDGQLISPDAARNVFVTLLPPDTVLTLTQE